MFRKFYRTPNKKAQRRGLFIADLTREGDLRVGFSLCNRTDPFNRELAHHIANERLKNGHVRIKTDESKGKPVVVNLVVPFNDEEGIKVLKLNLPQPMRKLLDEALNFFLTRNSKQSV